LPARAAPRHASASTGAGATRHTTGAHSTDGTDVRRRFRCPAALRLVQVALYSWWVCRNRISPACGGSGKDIGGGPRGSTPSSDRHAAPTPTLQRDTSDVGGSHSRSREGVDAGLCPTGTTRSCAMKSPSTNSSSC
jgi:hypothetical protein